MSYQPPADQHSSYYTHASSPPPQQPTLYHTQTPPPPPPPPPQAQHQQAPYTDPYGQQPYAPPAASNYGTSSGWTSPPPQQHQQQPSSHSPTHYNRAPVPSQSFSAFPTSTSTPPPPGPPQHTDPFRNSSTPPLQLPRIGGPRARFDSQQSMAQSYSTSSMLGPSAGQAQQGYAGLGGYDEPEDDWHPSRASMQDDRDNIALLPHSSSSASGVGRSGWPAAAGGGVDLSDPGVLQNSSSLNDDDDDDDGGPQAMHYGQAPLRVPRRNKTVKRVQLFMGHLILDCPVPSRLLEHAREKDEKEFSVMRYTAATCDPDQFREDRYALRQILYPETRKTELFIVLTMYNEDDELFLRTLRGVMQNIDYLCTKSKSKTWNDKGWQKVVVCIVSDGRSKIHPRTLACIQKLGCYQPGPAKNVVNGKPVTAHIYEYTTQMRVNSKLQIVPGNADSVPVQLLFCLKEKNQKKLNSHRWFFNAFGSILVPNVCVLIDVGTQPGPHSIYHLWKSFDLNSEVGGACGEIVALKGRYWSTLFKNPLVAAQNFEYKMSNILDKPLESIFGFISVLPGAFSAYRYIALQNDPRTGEGPLQKYFLGETMHGSDAGIFDANMYLAEDRILCWELVSKRESSWTLHYVKSAYGITDVPDTIPDLVSQRRRWLNGSFFASIHSVFHFYYLYRSRHSTTRKAFMHLLILYQMIQLIFSWFAIGNYFIAFYILTKGMQSYTEGLKWLNLVLTYIYAGLTMACFIMALGNRPKGSKWGYTTAFITFAIITVYMTFAAFWIAFQSIKTMTASGGFTASALLNNLAFTQIVLSIVATFGIYILASLIHYDPYHMVTSLVQYLLIAPSYISVMNVYAFCNTHDVSWGTKGQDKVATDLGVVTSGKGGDKGTAEINVTEDTQDLNAEYEDANQVLMAPKPKVVENISPEDAQEDYYKAFRTRLLLAWVLSNGFLVAIVLTASSTFSTTETASGEVEQSTSIYLTIVLYTVVVLALFRFIGSTAYIIVRMFVGE